MNRFHWDKNSFIKKSQIIHNNAYDYSLVEYKNTIVKVKIICPIHGIFEQIPKIHLQGSGCPKCKGGIKLNKEQFITKAMKIHGNKYCYSSVEYINSSTKVKITCDKNHTFYQTPASHLRNHGCPECLGNKKRNNNEFSKDAMKIHDNKYDYTIVDYKNNKTKVKIICPKHGIFEQSPIKHILNENGCPKCANEIRGNKLKINEDIFLDISNKIHNNKYDYSLMEYNSLYGKKIKIICPEHGIFEQIPGYHMKGGSCVKCSNKVKSLNKIDGINLFINKAIKIHFDKYDYSLVEYKNSHKLVKIICQKHGEFKQLPYIHLQGSGCPKCQTSKGENKIHEYLKSNNIKYNSQYSFKKCRYKQPLKFDFYLPEYNTCIEYDGEQHFNVRHKNDSKDKLELRKLRDLIKTEFCQNNNIKLIRIPYTNFKNINIILNEILKNNNIKNGNNTII